jgi:hypothetical protein
VTERPGAFSMLSLPRPAGDKTKHAGDGKGPIYLFISTVTYLRIQPFDGEAMRILRRATRRDTGTGTGKVPGPIFERRGSESESESRGHPRHKIHLSRLIGWRRKSLNGKA